MHIRWVVNRLEDSFRSTSPTRTLTAGGVTVTLMISILSLFFLLVLLAGAQRPPKSINAFYQQSLAARGITSLTCGAAALLRPSIAAAAAATEQQLSTSEFVAKWPYQKPTDILDYVYATAPDGDVDAVISAMDKFAAVYPMYKLTPFKASILSKEVANVQPSHVLELGTFFG